MVPGIRSAPRDSEHHPASKTGESRFSPSTSREISGVDLPNRSPDKKYNVALQRQVPVPGPVGSNHVRVGFTDEPVHVCYHEGANPGEVPQWPSSRGLMCCGACTAVRRNSASSPQVDLPDRQVIGGAPIANATFFEKIRIRIFQWRTCARGARHRRTSPDAPSPRKVLTRLASGTSRGGSHRPTLFDEQFLLRAQPVILISPCTQERARYFSYARRAIAW